MTMDTLEYGATRALAPCRFRWAFGADGERELIARPLGPQYYEHDRDRVGLARRLLESMRADGFTRGKIVDDAGRVLLVLDCTTGEINDAGSFGAER